MAFKHLNNDIEFSRTPGGCAASGPRLNMDVAKGGSYEVDHRLRRKRRRHCPPTGGAGRLVPRCFSFVILVATFAIPLAGCTSPKEYLQNGFKVGPNYRRPPAPVAADWIDAADKRVRNEADDLSKWWTVFQDPVLDQLICDASKQNLTLRASGASSPAATARPTSPSPAPAPLAAPCSPKSSAKKCSAPSNTPSATAGAFSFSSPLPYRGRKPSHCRQARLPCEKPLGMLLLHFPRQPAAGQGREPHGRVDEGAGCESVPEWIDQRVRNIVTHRHFLEISSRRNGRCSS